MVPKLSRLQSVISEDYLSEVESWPISLLRKKKREAEDLEAMVSYARKMIQGRIDILEAVLESGGDELEDTLIVRVKDAISSGPEVVRPRVAYNDVPPDELIPTLFEISEVAGIELELLSESSSAAQSSLYDLKSAEARVSSYRRELHRVVDILRFQLVVRYRGGELSLEEIMDDGVF